MTGHCCGSCAVGGPCAGQGESSERNTLNAIIWALAKRFGAVNEEGTLGNFGPQLTRLRGGRYAPPRDSEGRYMQPWPVDEHGRPKGGILVRVGRGPDPAGIEGARHGDLVEVPGGVATEFGAPLGVLWRIRPSSYYLRQGIHVGETEANRVQHEAVIDRNEPWWWMAVPFSRGWQQVLAKCWASMRQRDLQPNILVWRELGKPNPTRQPGAAPTTLAGRIMSAFAGPASIPSRTNSQPSPTTPAPAGPMNVLTRSPNMPILRTGGLVNQTLTRVPLNPQQVACLPRPSAGVGDAVMLPRLPSPTATPAAGAPFTLTFTAKAQVTVDRLLMVAVDTTTNTNRPELVEITEFSWENQQWENGGGSQADNAFLYASNNSEYQGNAIGLLTIPANSTVTIKGTNQGPNAIRIYGILFASPATLG